MKRTLAGLVVVLTAASAAAVDTHAFFIEVTNNNTCMGVEFSIGGETYAITSTPGRQMLGPTRHEFQSGTMVPATLKWYERSLGSGASCAGPTRIFCSGQFALAEGSGRVCDGSTTDVTQYMNYQVTLNTEGATPHWSIALEIYYQFHGQH